MSDNSGRSKINSRTFESATLHGSSVDSPINAASQCATSPQFDTSNAQTLASNSTTTDFEEPRSPSSYTSLTGLKSGSPTILFTSEFIPLYDSPGTNGASKLTPQGDAIRLKQEAKLLTSATAISVLSQSLPVMSLINDNKNDLRNFLQKLGNSGNRTNISQFISNYYDLSRSLFPSSYRFPSDGTQSPVNFRILLSRFGHPSTEISQFSETKLWLQSLFELKKSLLTHTTIVQPERVGPPNRPISTLYYNQELDTRVNNGEGRVVLNMSAPELPTFESLTFFIVSSDVYSQYEQSFVEFEQEMYCRLRNIERITTNDFKGTRYSLREEDLLIAASNIFRELRYCYSFAEDMNRQNLFDNFSYSKSERQNYKVWDALIGTMPGGGSYPVDIVQKLTPYSGSSSDIDNKSLASLGQIYSLLDGKNIRVDLFEKSPPSSSESTSGIKHYWEGDLYRSFISNSPSYELSKLEDKCNKAKNCIETMLEIVGADPQNNYQLDQFIPDVFKEKLFDLLTKEGSTPGWMYLKSSISNLNSGIRLLSLIFKLSLRKDDINLKKLKFRLFAWFYLLSRQSAERNSDYSEQIKFALEKVIDILIEYKDPNVNYSVIEDASQKDQNRTIIDVNPEITNEGNIENFRRIVYAVLSQSSTTALVQSTFEWFIRELNDYLIEGKTSYSGMSREKIAFAYFDLIVRIISSQTLETLRCFYSISNLKTIRMGFLVNRVSNELRESYFVSSPSYDKGPTIDYIKKLKDVYNKSSQDTLLRLQYLRSLRHFVMSVKSSAESARLMLSRESKISDFKGLFNDVFLEEVSRDQSIEQRGGGYSTFLSCAITKNQLRNMDHVYSEIKDRIDQPSAVSEKLRISPTINGLFPDKDFTDLTPLNSMGLLSHQVLSKYYSSVEFQPTLGNNKVIISAGIPHNLIERIQSEDSLKNPVVSNYIRIKVWKIDRLYPDILFSPKEFLFDMNRYPTRSLANWKLDSFAGNVPDLLKVPSKYYSPSYKFFSVHSGYFDNESGMSTFESVNGDDSIYMRMVIPEDVRDDILSNMYKNHSISYLCEEYLRWYTDEELSEDHYHNYTSIKTSNSQAKNSYQRVVEALKSTTPKNSGQNLVQFTDFSTGQSLSFPVDTFSSKTTSISKNTNQFTVNLTDTAVSYLRNPTLMTDTHSTKKRIVFPKKFDRVFNILIDPDDFTVVAGTITNIKKQTLVSSGPFEETSGGLLKRRNTTQNEMSLNEFFVTVEPYSYTST